MKKLNQKFILSILKESEDVLSTISPTSAQFILLNRKLHELLGERITLLLSYGSHEKLIGTTITGFNASDGGDPLMLTFAEKRFDPEMDIIGMGMSENILKLYCRDISKQEYRQYPIRQIITSS